MLLSIFNTISESIFIFIIGLFFTSFLVIIFRIGFKGIIFKILFHSLVIGTIAHFLSITNPLQNHSIVMFVVAIFYIFLFFILPKIKKNEIKILSFKSKGIFVIFLLFILILGKGEFLEPGNPKILSEKLNLGSKGELTYKSFDGIHSSVGYFNEYGGSAYDTIKYDLDLDGFVDIKSVDSDENGEIDDIEIYTYNSQKYTLLILLFIFLVSTYFLSGENKNSKGKKRKKDERSDEVKNKKHLSINNLNQKIIAFIILIGFVFSQLGFTYAMTELEGRVKMQKQSAQARRCAAEPFNDSLCIGVSKSSRLNLQHMQNPQYVSEAEAIMKKQQACYTSKCSAQKITSLQNEYKTFVIKWENTTPINFGKNKPTPTWSTEDIDRSTGTNNTDSGGGFDIDEGSIPSFDEIVGGIKEAIDDELDGESVSNIIGDAIGRAKEKIDKIKGGTDKEITTAKPAPITAEDVSKKIKNAIDFGGGMLDSINGKYLRQIEDISSGKTPNWKIIKSLEDAIKKGFGKTPKILSGIQNAISGLKGEEKRLFQVAMEKVGKFKKIIKALPFIGGVFEAYNDYRDLSRNFEGEDNKIYIGTTLITVGKFFISKNPVDGIIDVSSGVIGLLGFPERSDYMQDFSLGNRFKDVIKDAYTDDGATVMDTLVQAAADTKKVLNDPKAGVFEKGWKTTQFMVTVGYGGVVGGVKGLFNGITGLFG